jgi:D-3-phosphoglycerate dehydrogenase
MSSASQQFRVAVAGDFRDRNGEISFEPDALAILEADPDIGVTFLDCPVGGPLPEHVFSDFDAVIMKRTPVTAAELERSDLRLKHISRQGTGVEHLDIDACSAAGVLISNTPNSVRRPMASGAVTLLLNLAHNVHGKDAGLRADGWASRFRNQAPGLGGRTLGLIGCGSIGSEVLKLLAPWDMRRVVSAPSRTDAEIAQLDATRVELDDLLEQSDFVLLCCPLTASTRHIINTDALRRMKAGSYLINIGRGELVDEPALIDALSRGHLAGAALDVFSPEPPAADNPLIAMPNVILTAHNIGMTAESIRLGNTMAAAAVVDVAKGLRPESVVNPAVLTHARQRRVPADAPN